MINSNLVEVFVFLILPLMIVIILALMHQSNKNKEAVEKANQIEKDRRGESVAEKIGSTYLDRFFVECVLAGCSDLSIEKNKARAMLIADKYKMIYDDIGIEALYNKGLNAHKHTSQNYVNDELSKLRQIERKKCDELTRYSNLYGKEKTRVMLIDIINELSNDKQALEQGAQLYMSMGLEKEKDWAVRGGIASGIAGSGAGIATALDVQAQNADIRARNDSLIRSKTPVYSKLVSSSSDIQNKIDRYKKSLEMLSTTLIDEKTTKEEVLDMLNVVCDKYVISKTGAIEITATVEPKSKLFIFDDVPAYADGTIIAKVLDEKNNAVSTAKMVFPLYGVNRTTTISGIGLSGAKENTRYHITFEADKLWLVE